MLSLLLLHALIIMAVISVNHCVAVETNALFITPLSRQARDIKDWQWRPSDWLNQQDDKNIGCPEIAKTQDGLSEEEEYCVNEKKEMSILRDNMTYLTIHLDVESKIKQSWEIKVKVLEEENAQSILALSTLKQITQQSGQGRTREFLKGDNLYLRNEIRELENEILSLKSENERLQYQAENLGAQNLLLQASSNTPYASGYNGHNYNNFNVERYVRMMKNKAIMDRWHPI